MIDLEKVNEDLYKIYERKIVDYNLDVLFNKCYFKLENLDPSSEEYGHIYTLEFKNVKCCTFFNNSKQLLDRVSFKDETYLQEFTSILIMASKDCIQLQDKEYPWLLSLGSKINVTIEVWSSVILLYADEMILDGKSYMIGELFENEQEEDENKKPEQPGFFKKLFS